MKHILQGEVWERMKQVQGTLLRFGNVPLRTGVGWKESLEQSACLSPPMIAGPSGSNLGLTNMDGMGYASQCVEVSNEAEGRGQRARDGGNGGERRHQPMDFDWAD